MLLLLLSAGDTELGGSLASWALEVRCQCLMLLFLAFLSRGRVGVQLCDRVSCYYYMLMKELSGICLKGCGLVRRA